MGQGITQHKRKRALQLEVFKIAVGMGWEVRPNANDGASSRDFPDMVLVKDGRLIFAYFKSPYEKITKTQQVWIIAFKRCGYPVSVHIWRWSDLDDIRRLLGAGKHEALVDEFQKCAAAWKRETGHLSVAGQIAKHHAYRRIIEMGESVIPLILEDLSEEPNHWFLALSAIANEAPAVPERDKGDMKAISAAWIEWGREKDYIE